MDNQFTDLSHPDYNAEYYCDDVTKATGFTPLMKYALMNEIMLVKDIVSKNPDEIYRKNSKGYTALMMACCSCVKYSSIECIEILLDADYKKDSCERSINIQSNNGQSALMITVFNSAETSSIECVNLLTKSGADVHLQNQEGWTALMMACFRFKSIHKDCVEILVDAGANIDHQDKSGLTPLMVVCRYCNNTNSLEHMKYLIRSGANISLRNVTGMTALHICCKYCKKEALDCIRLLLESGSNIDHQDAEGYTPLMISCRYFNETSSIDCVELLLKLGANLDIQKSDQMTCLCFLCSGYRPAPEHATELFDIVVRLLLAHGANANLTDNTMSNPLMYYCCLYNFEKSDTDTLLLLINATKNVTAKRNGNISALNFFDANPTSKSSKSSDTIRKLLTSTIKITDDYDFIVKYKSYLSDEIVKRLDCFTETYPLLSSDITECPICFDDKILATTNCKHQICLCCLYELALCPFCRTKLKFL